MIRSLRRIGRKSGNLTAPTFVAAGAGAVHATSQNVLQVGMPASITTGDVLLLHMFSRTAAILPTTLSGWIFLDNKTFLDGRHQVVFYRVVDGTETTQTVPLAGAPNVAVGRTYAWRGVALDAVTGLPTFSNTSEGTGTSTQFNMPSKTTSSTNNVAIFLACFDAVVSVASPSGESGGDWVETVAEYTTTAGSDATIFADHANLSTATTISGGTVGPGGGSDDGAYYSFTLHGSSGVPTFVAAGAGTDNGVIATLTAAYPAGIATGDLLVAQLCSRTTPVLPTAITGWTSLAQDLFSSNAREQYLFGRIYVGTGTSLVVPVTGTLDVCVARMYAFRNCAGLSQREDSQVSLAVSSVITGPTLGPTDQDKELGVSFISFDDDEALAAYSGATGGTWAEAVAEYTTATGNDFGVQCQIVNIPTAGTTVSGGTVTTTGDDGIQRSWSFRGATS